jgi:hypothetical protein
VVEHINDEYISLPCFDNLIKGTWKPVLMTPLSLVGDYWHGTSLLSFGSDFQDFTLVITSRLPCRFVSE